MKKHFIIMMVGVLMLVGSGQVMAVAVALTNDSRSIHTKSSIVEPAGGWNFKSETSDVPASLGQFFSSSKQSSVSAPGYNKGSASNTVNQSSGFDWLGGDLFKINATGQTSSDVKTTNVAAYVDSGGESIFDISFQLSDSYEYILNATLNAFDGNKIGWKPYGSGVCSLVMFRDSTAIISWDARNQNNTFISQGVLGAGTYRLLAKATTYASIAPTYNQVQGTNADFNIQLLIPEPATLLLLGLGGFVLRKKINSTIQH